MKHLIKLIVVVVLTGMVGCDYLDVVPNDTATLDHAFSNRSVTEKFLRTCYSHLPDPTNPFYYPPYFTSRDEFDFGFEVRSLQTVAGMISEGLQNTDNPLQNYWLGEQGGKSLYVAIRDCNIFLENIHIPQDVPPVERARWIAEVKFLKAYYHFFLMQLYGPIVLVKENLPLSASPEEVKTYREPVDECVDYIVELLDDAILDLPPTIPDPTREQGRISQTIALAVKAKVLAWAASPLFNGNPDYKEWTDNRGKQLVSDTYDPAKWERAAAAIKEAIETCHAVGLKLYEFNKNTSPQTFNMNDTLVQMMTIRKAITEDMERNPGMIWASPEISAPGKGTGAATPSWLGDFLRSIFPIMYSTDYPSGVGGHCASWHMVNLFYTNNGVPMEEDKYFDYANRFQLRRATPGDHHQSYIATGEITVNMHFNREPRFYADLCFDRGFMELSTTTADGGASFGPYLRFRHGEVFQYLSSYMPKKLVAFETTCSQGDHAKRYLPHYYMFPLIRLADLYLLYSEALNEVKEQPDAEVYEWIDRVREKAGLDGVRTSWARASINPDKPYTKEGMREIIQKERLIELAFEGQRFWDVRRWKIADKFWTLPPTRWAFSRNPEEYYVPEVYYHRERTVTVKDYLYPISLLDIRINPNLVQTYGW
ncbi:MAG: RagB/SusD family nutrient uptake outer membrane protein [Bacteroidota bacterium]|nr:RagB/SusD family nutrient uptake outer membrane protein [Bacteroidota bacterium]